MEAARPGWTLRLSSNLKAVPVLRVSGNGPESSCCGTLQGSKIGLWSTQDTSQSNSHRVLSSHRGLHSRHSASGASLKLAAPEVLQRTVTHTLQAAAKRWATSTHWAASSNKPGGHRAMASELEGLSLQDRPSPELDVSTSYLPGGAPELDTLPEEVEEEVLAEHGSSARHYDPSVEPSSAQLPEDEYSSEGSEPGQPGTEQPRPGSALVPPLRLEGSALRRASDAACEVQVLPGSGQAGLPAEEEPEDVEGYSDASDRCASSCMLGCETCSADVCALQVGPGRCGPEREPGQPQDRHRPRAHCRGETSKLVPSLQLNVLQSP